MSVTRMTEKRGTSPAALPLPLSIKGAHTVPKPSLSPYRQGRLDALCGVYAIINALRRCLGANPSYDEFWPDLFEALLLTEREVGLADALTLGIAAKPFRAIFRYAIWSMAD